MGSDAYSGGPKVGADAFLYINTGPTAVPTYTVEAADITDMAIDDFSVTFADLKRRASKWTKGVPSLFNAITISFRLVHGLDLTLYQLLQGHFLARTPFLARICDAAMPGTATGLEGFDLPLALESFPWDLSLEDLTGHDLTARVAYMCDDAGTPAEIDPALVSIAKV